MIGPKPNLLDPEYCGDKIGGYERWKRDELVWCAEAMQDAAGRIERVMAEQGLDGMLMVTSSRRVPRWRLWLERVL